MNLLQPSMRARLWGRCFQRSYSTRTPYSHLEQTVFQPPLKGQMEGPWRDTAAQYARIGSIVDSISAVAQESVNSMESNIIPLLEKKDGLLSASNWPPISSPTLRMFWNPTNNVDLVLPKECEPSDQDMAPYERFLKAEYDRDFFLDYIQRFSGKYGEFGNSHEDSVAMALCRLLRCIDQSQTMDMEDKLKVYTDDLFCTLRDFVSMENGKFSVLRSENIVGTIFGHTYNAKPEFALQDQRGSFQVFMENPLAHSKPDVFSRSISQKSAEALAIATTRYFESETLGKSQEVFGIGIKHYYFTFWHAHFSREYLYSLSKTSQQWQGDEHVILKSYPYSQFGLNFCDPAQRKDILRYIHRILNYLNY